MGVDLGIADSCHSLHESLKAIAFTGKFISKTSNFDSGATVHISKPVQLKYGKSTLALFLSAHHNTLIKNGGRE